MSADHFTPEELAELECHNCGRKFASAHVDLSLVEKSDDTVEYFCAGHDRMESYPLCVECADKRPFWMGADQQTKEP